MLGKAGGLVGLGKAGGLGVLGGSHVVPRTPLQTLRRADFNNMSKKIAICTQKITLNGKKLCILPLSYGFLMKLEDFYVLF